MTNIIFARTRHIYESYYDFWRLVELSNFPTIYVDEIDISKPGVYITTPMNGDYRAHLANEIERLSQLSIPILAHLILWNIERPSGSAGSVGQYAIDNRELIYMRYVDEIWVSDRRLAEETSLRYVTLGSHPKLGYPGIEKTYDFTHMSAEIPRRQTIYKYFGRQSIGYNCWPPERDTILRKSRFALNVHQDNHPFCEPLRFALFASYMLPIVSETVYDGYPYAHDDTIIYAGYDGLVSKLKQMLADPYKKWKQMGERCRQLMCYEYEFEKMIRQAVEETVGEWR